MHILRILKKQLQNNKAEIKTKNEKGGETNWLAWKANEILNYY